MKKADNMNNEELCLALMAADSGDDVVSILRDASYWDDPTAWRFVGDNENNFSTIGNQQAEGVAALAEKIVNSIDARLTLRCLEEGIEPSSSSAPKSTREAVARFMESGIDPMSGRAGRITEWTDEKIRNEGRNITLAATGSKANPSISIADTAHGAAPDDFPDTFLSLNKNNKLRIPFVQGKFNMGGTGALQFCGKPYNLQLVVSRRSPYFPARETSTRKDDWGFTIIRRETMPGTRSSIFTFLAPINASNRNGQVLSFPSATLKILPEANAKVRGAYETAASHGTLIKLYEYSWDGGKSNIVMSGGGLRQRLEQSLPQLALPVRVFECRDGYSGHAGSFSTNLTGLAVRLERNKAEKLEPGSPATHLMDIDGQEIRVAVYVFKSNVDVAEYRTAKNGITFIVNGQTHATVSSDFFARSSVGLGYLSESMMVLLDCTGLDQRTREDLFLNSRDRFRDNHLSKSILKELEATLHDDTYLRELNNRRRREAVDATLAEDRPLADVLRTLLKSSPMLERLFLKGQAVPAPFGPEGNATGSGSSFAGKTYPTFFRFKGKDQDEVLERDGRIDTSPRISFETDAADEYFTRDIDPGELSVYRIDSELHERIDRKRLTGPRSGIVALTLNLPGDVEVGDTLKLEFEISDPSRVDPFVNTMVLHLKSTGATNGHGGHGKRSVNHGNGDKGGEGNFALPTVVKVREEEWAKYSFHTFTAEDSMWIVPNTTEDGESVYEYYVNVDNKYLKTVQKDSPRGEPALLEAKFVYGNVLLGLALLNDRQIDENESSENVENSSSSMVQEVGRVTRLVAPVLLPIIDELSDLTPDQFE